MKDDVAELHSTSVDTVLPKVLADAEDTHAKRKRGALWIAVCLVVIGAVGGITYYFWNNQTSQTAILPELQDIAAVIPKDVVAIVAYNFNSEDQKAFIRTVWGSQQPTISGGQSDPLQIIEISDIQEAYYFVLPDNSSPFLAIKKNASSEQFVSQQSNIESIEQGGWYILQSLNVDQYKSELAAGTLADTSYAPFLHQQDVGMRYIINPTFAAKVFATTTAFPLGLQPMVLDVDVPAAQDGILRAHYASSQQPIAAQVHPAVTELLSLVPTDADVLKVGRSFAEDVSSPISSLLSIASNPGIQQFVDTLTAPYALFHRVGADGVDDMGLVVALPDTLKKTLGHSDPIVEQLLALFVPFITGKGLENGISFGDGMYSSVPVRYTNIQGQTQALDYTIGDNFILAASSREGMNALIDAAVGSGEGILAIEPWATLVEDAGSSLTSYNMFVGMIKDPALLSLMPIDPGVAQASFIISTSEDNTGVNTQATVLVRQ